MTVTTDVVDLNEGVIQFFVGVGRDQLITITPHLSLDIQAKPAILDRRERLTPHGFCQQGVEQRSAVLGGARVANL